MASYVAIINNGVRDLALVDNRGATPLAVGTVNYLKSANSVLTNGADVNIKLQITPEGLVAADGGVALPKFRALWGAQIVSGAIVETSFVNCGTVVTVRPR